MAHKQGSIKESRDVFYEVFLSVDFHFFLEYMSFFNLRKLFLCASRVNPCHSACRSSAASLTKACIGAQSPARVRHEPSFNMGILLDPQVPLVSNFRKFLWHQEAFMLP